MEQTSYCVNSEFYINREELFAKLGLSSMTFNRSKQIRSCFSVVVVRAINHREDNSQITKRRKIVSGRGGRECSDRS